MPNNGDNIDNGLRLVDSISWQKGAHSLTFGADIRYQQYSPINNNSPSIGFGAGQTAVSTTLGATGNGLASELLGLATGGAQNVYAHQSRWISWYYSGYVQDDWKITRNLTLNLGLNYSVDVPRREALELHLQLQPHCPRSRVRSARRAGLWDRYAPAAIRSGRIPGLRTLLHASASLIRRRGCNGQDRPAGRRRHSLWPAAIRRLWRLDECRI